MADSCQNPSIQARHFLIFPLTLVRFALGSKQIPRKMTTTGPLYGLTDKDQLVKQLLTSIRKIRLLAK